MTPTTLRPLLTALLCATGTVLAANASAPAPATDPITISVSAKAPGSPFPHYWEQMFGSGRAVLALRDNYRRDIRMVKGATGFGYVRFHAIFHDEVGLYDVDAAGKAVYNFSYVDQIYDGLLADGVRPFVELSFMPQKMAADPKKIFGFWYRPNISPPKDYAQWDAMLEALARHLIDRYGIDEVAQWYFEVWNEPNIGFWGGEPYQPTYFELYDHSARALKQISSRLRVGGPSTAQAAWAGDFIRHCHEHGIPVDFVSSHVYANDSSQDVFKNDIPIARDRMVCTSVRKVHDEIASSPMPTLPLIWSEYNASFANEPNVTDTVYMGPWLASTIGQCDGLTQAMSYWSFSDVFEEGGVIRTPFYGGFGLVAENDIPKPAFNAFAMLHHLGDTRLHSDADSALITRRKDGTLVLALWNYAPPEGTGAGYTAPGTLGPAKAFALNLKGVPANAHATIWRVDRDHGNAVRAFDAMGRPASPSREQYVRLREAGKLGAPTVVALKDGKLALSIPSYGLAVVEVR